MCIRDRTSVKASASVRIQFLHRVINFGCPYPLRAAIPPYCIVHMILPVSFCVSASSPLENAGVGQPGPQDRIGLYDMRRSQKHERQSHEKRRNEDHDKILQNTAPVCGKAGIDLRNVEKRSETPAHRPANAAAPKIRSYAIIAETEASRGREPRPDRAETRSNRHGHIPAISPSHFVSQSSCRSIHAISSFTMRSCSFSVSSRPTGT